CCNNHLYWRGLQAAIVGVVAEDDALFQYGVRAYRSALRDMNDDGSFRLEMARGRRAIHYQNFALLPLIYIAEVASRQGYDLYGATVDGKSIHHAVGFLLSALEDPTLVRRYTDAEQDLGFVRKGMELNWLEPYQRRFPTPRIARLLAQVRPVAHRWSGGPSTLYFEVSSEPRS
ncbi:MAG: alginate lyase family protein, partial [Geminicoccales bacterium]